MSAKTLATILVWLVAAPAAAESPWALKETTDSTTDEVTKAACARDSKRNEVCFEFIHDEEFGELNPMLYMTIELAEGRFGANRYPDVRVDSNKAHRGKDIEPVIEIARILRVKRMIPYQQHKPRWVRRRVGKAGFEPLPDLFGLLGE